MRIFYFEESTLPIRASLCIEKSNDYFTLSDSLVYHTRLHNAETWRYHSSHKKDKYLVIRRI